MFECGLWTVNATNIGADSMGAMGVIAPTAKKLWGDALKSPPREFCYVIFETVTCTVKREFIMMPVTTVVLCADFSLKMHQKRLAGGLRPNPLGELTALSQTS